MDHISDSWHRATHNVGQIEKPFGHDLESSRELQRALDPNWREDEIFRVDHYLGKEVVNNLLVLRFGNEIFGAIWNAKHIDNIEVTSYLEISLAASDRIADLNNRSRRSRRSRQLFQWRRSDPRRDAKS